MFIDLEDELYHSRDERRRRSVGIPGVEKNIIGK
jgi:hypothetical protein